MLPYPMPLKKSHYGALGRGLQRPAAKRMQCEALSVRAGSRRLLHSSPCETQPVDMKKARAAAALQESQPTCAAAARGKAGRTQSADYTVSHAVIPIAAPRKPLGARAPRNATHSVAHLFSFVSRCSPWHSSGIILAPPLLFFCSLTEFGTKEVQEWYYEKVVKEMGREGRVGPMVRALISQKYTCIGTRHAPCTYKRSLHPAYCTPRAIKSNCYLCDVNRYRQLRRRHKVGYTTAYSKKVFNVNTFQFMAKYPLGILGPIEGRLGKRAKKKAASKSGETRRVSKPPSPKQIANRERFGMNSHCAAGMKIASNVGLRAYATKKNQHSILTKRLMALKGQLDELRISGGPGAMVLGLRASANAAQCTVRVRWTCRGAGRKVFLAVVSRDRRHSAAAEVPMAAGSYTFTYESAGVSIAWVFAFSTDARGRDVSDTAYYKLE